MKLVEAEKEELDTYVELWFDLAKGMEKYSEFNNIIYDRPEDVDKNAFIEQFKDKDYTYYLLRIDGENIGFITLKEGEHPSREYNSYTQIVNLFIREGFRNQGYGSEAVEKVKKIAKDNGSDHLKVSSEWNNEGARKFYNDNGFEEKQVTFVQKLY